MRSPPKQPPVKQYVGNEHIKIGDKVIEVFLHVPAVGRLGVQVHPTSAASWIAFSKSLYAS